MRSQLSFIAFQFLWLGVYGQTAAQIYPTDFIAKPSLTWTFNTSGPIFSSPVIDVNTVYFGGLDSNLYAVNVKNGKLLWKFKTRGEIRSTPAVDQTDIYVVSGDGCLYSFDKNTHQLNWKFIGEGDRKYELFSFADYYQSSPAVSNGMVFFGAGAVVFAVNKTSGGLVWKYKTGSVVHSSPLVCKDKLYIGSFDGYFYSFDASEGKLVWKFKSIGQRYFPIGEMQGSPTVFEKMIFTGSRDFNLYALDVEKGTGLWNRQFRKGWAMAKPVVHDSILYVGTSDDKVMVAFNPYNGNILWETDVKFNVFGSSCFSQRMLYFGTLMGRLYGMDAKTGKIMWAINSAGYGKNRLKYFKDDDTYRDDITSVIQKDDDFLESYYQLGAIFSTPAIAGDLLLVTSVDGKLYAYRRS